MGKFVHLHCHSEYSLLDGLTKPEEIIEVAEENGSTHVSITDHGTLGGLYRFNEAASKSSVTPIFGEEAYFVPDIKNDDKDSKAERFHLILLAKNNEGLRNLFKMNRIAWTYGFYHKPRVDFEMLEAYGDGIVALSGCMGGAIAQAIINDDTETADKMIERFSSIFKDDFYFELQPWEEPDQVKVNLALQDYAQSWDIPMVGTIDCHYPRKKDREIEEILLAVGTSGSLTDKEKQYAKEHLEEAKSASDMIEKMNVLWPNRRLSFQHIPVYIMPDDEVYSLFDKNVGRTDILETSLEIAEKCSAKLNKRKPVLPSYPEMVGVKESSEEYLSDIAYFRLKEMGLNTQEYRDVLDMELKIINEKKFADYFLILWDVCEWAKKNGIGIGPGRGSAGGSLLAYCLGITKVDPVKYKLLFWRFLNPERNDYPDIDIDFEDRRRDEVKQYVKDRWGADNVASIATYGTLKEKSAFKYAAKVFGVPYKDSNSISSRMRDMDDIKNMSGEVAKRFMRDYSDAIEAAKGIRGTLQQAGAHAAGVVISPVPLHDILPIESRKDEAGNRIEVTAFDKNELEPMGLVKFDALSLNTVSVIMDTLKKVKENYGIDVEAQSLDVDDPDPRVFEILSEGKTIGVFQSEGASYTKLLKDLEAENFNDLVVANGLIRPGAAETQGPKFAEGKRGGKITYASDLIKPILEETYGAWIFEEQLMSCLVTLAGFSWGKADRFRKIISKKLDASEFEPYRESFMEGVTQHISVSKAESMWADILKACTYMFNKSHSVSYSLLTYQTAWLKVNYPKEFIWALLTNERDFANITTYLFEAQKIGVTILPPDINTSGETFDLDGDAIRFGLGNVLGVGNSAIDEIMANRPFSSYEQFIETCSSSRVKSDMIDNLNKVGAFESIGFVSEYEHEHYYGPILNYPIFLNEESVFSGVLSTCKEAEADEDGMHIIRGVIKGTKRTDKYYRIEIEDDTGTIAVFADQSVDVSKRDSVIALVGDSALHYIEDYQKAQESPPKFVQYFQAIKEGKAEEQYGFLLDADTTYGVESQKTVAFLFSISSFKTKKGAKMGSAYWWSPELGFFKTMMFPGSYNYNIKVLEKIFGWYVMQIDQMKDGGLALDKALSPERYCSLKKIKHTPLPFFAKVV